MRKRKSPVGWVRVKEMVLSSGVWMPEMVLAFPASNSENPLMAWSRPGTAPRAGRADALDRVGDVLRGDRPIDRRPELHAVLERERVLQAAVRFLGTLGRQVRNELHPRLGRRRGCSRRACARAGSSRCRTPRRGTHAVGSKPPVKSKDDSHSARNTPPACTRLSADFGRRWTVHARGRALAVTAATVKPATARASTMADISVGFSRVAPP